MFKVSFVVAAIKCDRTMQTNNVQCCTLSLSYVFPLFPCNVLMAASLNKNKIREENVQFQDCFSFN